MPVNLEVLGKILAKAEGTDNAEEREIFMSKAQEIAATLGVELAMARAKHADKSKREEPIRKTIKVGNERSKKNDYFVKLFHAIAQPHDVRITIGYKNLYCTAYGLPSDISIVEALFAMSAVQMMSDANDAIAQGVQKTAGRWGEPVDGRVYRAHFYEGFISRLTNRLWLARRDAIRATGGKSEGASTLTQLVLRDKAKDVDNFYNEQNKHWAITGTTKYWEPPSRNDYVASAVIRGEQSATNLDLNLDPKVESGSKRQIDRS